MNDLKVMAINSFPVHGMAGLKASMRILGSRVLPVPSVVLNGLTNMPYVRKHFLDFKELLYGSFRLVEHRNQKVILSIGYLGLPEQVDAILEVIESYRSCIQLILTDPISGDHGKAYIPDDIIVRWPELVGLSDFVFPNLTELRLISGFAAGDTQHTDVYLNHFKNKYPATGLIVTSFKTDENDMGVLFHQGDNHFHYSHPYLPKYYGGTGDAFMAYFILFHFYQLMPVEIALQQASKEIQEKISMSKVVNSDELLI